MGHRVVSTSRLVGACVAVLALSAGCGSAGSGSASATRSSGAAPSSATPAASSELVGRWEREQTCEDLIGALHSAEMDAVLPSMLPDWFPDATPSELAHMKHPCRGTMPRPHSHFFTQDGRFGSVDESGQQVDDGTYQVVDDHTVRIGDGSFTYRITNGDTLVLQPVITAADRRQALAHPLDFTVAGWQVAVAWNGMPWKRVDCDEWC